MAGPKFSDYLGLKHLPKDCRRVKSAVPLKWQVGFENGIFSRWPEFTVSDIVWYVLKL